jgi:hypothetical protein
VATGVVTVAEVEADVEGDVGVEEPDEDEPPQPAVTHRSAAHAARESERTVAILFSVTK